MFTTYEKPRFVLIYRAVKISVVFFLIVNFETAYVMIFDYEMNVKKCFQDFGFKMSFQNILPLSHFRGSCLIYSFVL